MNSIREYDLSGTLRDEWNGCLGYLGYQVNNNLDEVMKFPLVRAWKTDVRGTFDTNALPFVFAILLRASSMMV